MRNTDILQQYEQLIPFWSEVCGPGTEICLYDLSAPEHALIAVWNPRPGRQPGDALPPVLRELAEKGFSGPQPWVTLPQGEGQNADLYCRVCPVGNPENPAGIVCATKDLHPARELAGAVHAVLDRYALELPRREEPEDADLTVLSMMQARIAAIIAEYCIPPARMTVQEKVEVVHRLSESGIMNMKGAVSEIAAQLCVSVPTVYRYMNRTPH